MVGDLMLELPEFVPGLATLNCTSIDMGRSIWHPVGLTMTPSTNRSTVQLKMRLPALGVKFRAAKAWMNVKSAVPPSRRPVGKPFLACAYVFIVSRRKIYKNQLIQDIIAEVRKTASYVNYNWRDA
ncbi:conserved protein [Escherichia coli chi7122]|nr:conserved protein [Escherichia coli]CCK45990.1 conserved protein [Escherichia coli chi7122]